MSLMLSSLRIVTPRILKAANTPAPVLLFRSTPRVAATFYLTNAAAFNQFSTSAQTRNQISQKRKMATVKHTNPLLAAIADDHQEMYDYYDQYKANVGNPQAQQKWANQLMWEVARHAVGEEIVVYPLMEEYLGDKGVKLADNDRSDHQYVKERLYRLEGMTVGTPEYNDMLGDVMTHLHKHNDSEENTDLPLLTKEIGKDHALLAANSFKRTKKFAPTHPHPSAPNKPPFETFVGLMTAPIDKLRDAFEQFPTAEEREESHK